MKRAAEVTAESKSNSIFRRSYTGHPSQIAQVRSDLAEVTASFPLADEVILLASELCTNAVVHGCSGRPGGIFTVLANVYPGQFVRIEVRDQGGAWDALPHEDERPHGLDIVRTVAGDGNWGVDGDSSAGWIVWVRLHWPKD